MRASTLLAGALALVASGVQAQDTITVIRPGDARVDASRLPLRSDTFLLATEPKLALRLVITTSRASLEEGAALLRVESISVPGGEVVSVDSFAARTPSLAPVFDVEFGSEFGRRLRFFGDSIAGSRVAEGKRTFFGEHLSAPAFYLNTTDLLLGSLTLVEGMRFRIGMWDPDHGPYTLVGEVRAPETVVTLEQGRCTAWRVEVAEREANSVYWIEVSSHSLVRYKSGPLEIRAYRHPACPAPRAGTSSAR